MAKDVASRVSGDDEVAALELRERAAARFDSIHNRWSAVKSSATETGSSEASSPENAHAEMPASETPAAMLDPAIASEPASDLDPGSVRVTPILGIATDDQVAPRPRFKTLMGVPRNSPEVDQLAGLELDVQRRHDTVRLERPAPSAPAPVTGMQAAGAPVTAGPARAGRPAADAREEPSLTATSWPWERNTVAHKQSPRVVPPLAVRSEWSALVESSLDVSSEVAALRPSAARRSWLVGLGGIGAIVALLAVGAPRERTLALHWLRQEYQARMQPLVESTTGGGITETGALRPTAMAANDVATSSAPPSGSAAGTALPGADMPPAASPSAASLAARTVADVPRARDGAEQNVTAAEPARDAHANEKPASEKPPAQDAFAKGTETKAPTAKATSARTTNARATTAMAHEAHSATGGPVKARARVAAPRKPSTDPAALAANVTKPRATRQNSPRKDTGGGIIRETPF